MHTTQYDRWLLKTVTGAINTARISKLPSAATSLQVIRPFRQAIGNGKHRFFWTASKAVRFPHHLLDHLAIRMVFSVASLAGVASCRQKWLVDQTEFASNRNHPHSTCIGTIGFEDIYADQINQTTGVTMSLEERLTQGVAEPVKTYFLPGGFEVPTERETVHLHRV
ncbi:hypothetical protein OS493_019909 [Desmophyllum pertusum]|uniref:Uncharacterized protein n=1 Tax=Desmophyllum pertusum TaxID=174260 RepID=A0A9W9YN76_9CNID|nr:hypothetical protein OS493_019909 [Desmophyllum pertusum]